MTDPETIASAGKRLVAIAAGRAFKEDVPRDTDEAERPGDPSGEKEGEQSRGTAAQAPAEGSDDLPPPTRGSPTKSA